MVINTTNTHWVFLCAIKSEDPIKGNPERHLKDVVLGLSVLVDTLKIHRQNISLLLDSQPISIQHQQTHDSLLTYIDKIHPISDFNNIITKTTLPNIVVLIFGHGSIDGLDANYKLKPFELVNILHSRQNLESGVVVFGQCFSGIYNFVELYGNKSSNAHLCFLGASNLNSSLSSAQLNEGQLRWVANLFMLFFFDWLSIKGVDIDGDGRTTLMDVYKYAGGRTSENLLTAKEKIASTLYYAQKELDQIETEYKNKNFTTSEEETKFKDKYEFDKDFLLRTIKNASDIKHTVQDPWFLNSNKAREIEFQL
jgi:hypothetical protein